MNLKSELISSSLWAVFGSLIASLSKMVVLIYTARILTPEVFGIAAIVLGITIFVPMVLQSGMQLSIITSGSEDKELIDTIFSFFLSVGVLSILIMWILSPYVSEYYNSNISFFLIAASAGILFKLLESIFYNIFRAKLDYKKQNYMKIYKGISFIFFSIILIFFVI